MQSGQNQYMHISGPEDQTKVKKLSPLSADVMWMTTVRSSRSGSEWMRSKTGEDRGMVKVREI